MSLHSCLVLFLIFLHVNCNEYDNNVVFTVFKPDNTSFIWESGSNISGKCDVSGKFAIVAHGWQASKSDWIQRLVVKLLKYRGGCVISMNWGHYSDDIDYVEVVSLHWAKVSDVLTRRLISLESEGVSPDNIFMYGHSLGGRLVTDSGTKFGKRKIFQIDACDSAGPGFLLYDAEHDPKDAAKNVQCIHTSTDAGTWTYDCHQDWLMGKCGISQPAATDPGKWLMCLTRSCPNSSKPKISHSLCNEFYISAFENDFVANNANKCRKVVDAKDLPAGFKMGYMEMRRNSSIQGKIPSPTGMNYPYNVV